MKPWLPLYLLLVLAATLSPGLGVCGSRSVSFEPRLVDFVLNLALFLPLGLALAGHRLVFVATVAVLLSGAIEVGQLLLPRISSAADLVSNVLGAVLGHRLAPRLGPLERRLGVRGGLAALLATALAVGWMGWMRGRIEPNDLSNWQAFPLVIGDEADGERSWRGTIAELRVYDRALPAAADVTGEAAPWSRGGPVLWLRFETPRRARLDGPRGPRPLEPKPPARSGMALGREGLWVGDGGWQLPEEAAVHLLTRLRSTHEFSVAARIRPESTELIGPARILTLSRDSQHRDFTLGQQGRELVLRVRTPHTGANGTSPPLETRDAPLGGGWVSVLASFDGPRARIDVDGRCRTEMLYLEALGPAPLGSGVATAVVALTALAGLGAAAACGGSRRRRLAALCAGSGLAWAALLAVGAWAPIEGFAAIAPWLGVAAAAAAVPLAQRES